MSFDSPLDTKLLTMGLVGVLVGASITGIFMTTSIKIFYMTMLALATATLVLIYRDYVILKHFHDMMKHIHDMNDEFLKTMKEHPEFVEGIAEVCVHHGHGTRHDDSYA